MKKYIILMSNNIKKNIGQYISLGIMIIISATMLHLGVITKLNFKDDFDNKWIAQNSADIFITASKDSINGDLIDEIKEIKNVSEVEERKGILLKGKISYENNEFDLTQNFFSYEDITKNSSGMNKIEVAEKADKNYEDAIYLSYWFKFNGGYKIGDQYNFKVDNTEYKFTVAGFVEDTQYGNNAFGVIGGYLSKEAFEDLAKQVSEENRTTTVLIKANNIKNSKAIYNEISDLTSGKLKGFSLISYYDVCRQLRTMTTDIFVAIFIVFAALVVIISILVVNFKVRNRIEEEMSNMGALKAMGYTSKQIINSMIFPYLCIGIITVIIGIAISYGVLPLIESAFAAQSGMIWRQGFSMISAIITAVIIVSLILVFCYLSARKIKRLQVIEALRGGLKTHSFRRNYFPIDKTVGNINLILALKNFMGNLRQNILLIIVIVSVSVASIFAGTMFYNTVIKTENFCNAITEEAPSAILTFADEDSSKEKEEIDKMKNVKESIYYNTDSVTFNGENVIALITDDFDKLSNDICYEGRNPIHSNEIALGNQCASDAAVKIGDNVEITYGDNTEKYLVTGLIQSVNYSGKAIEFTGEGFIKINKDFKEKTLYVYLDDESKSEKFIKDVKEQFKSITNTVDYVRSTESAVGVFVTIIGILCIGIFIFTALLITLILYLLIKTIIVHKKQEMGILKSMGYTTRNLMLQTALSFVPALVIGTTVGSIISYKYMNNILSVMLKSVGVIKVNFEIPVIMVMICALTIIIFTFIISILLCRKIKKISAYSLIKE